MRIFIDLEFAKDNKENVKEGIPILFKQKQLDKKLILSSKISHDTELKFVFLNLLLFHFWAMFQYLHRIGTLTRNLTWNIKYEQGLTSSMRTSKIEFPLIFNTKFSTNAGITRIRNRMSV